MAAHRILLVESERASAPSFAPLLEKKGYSVTTRHQVDAALSRLADSPPDLLILDAASMKTSGTRMSRSARGALNGVPIVLIAPEGARPDPGNGATVTLVKPFTPRKLLNRVARLLPGDDSFNLEVGPIKLNLAQRKVRCRGKDARLTPKQARLLEVFMHNPGKLLTRATLIRQVWHTDYTGDTRTLDVHMSWLRRSLDEDPRRPGLLKTIRGMGYRLDVPAESGSREPR
jgi:DNA-binding response OmpR family regulator